ncbi:HEAT repeat domain-containing protein [Microcoleus sp. FACHB-68]|uniref:HEAT repeat domain-containing protein n=1 Tax=Microcoleus sp. FACHB-68 TaxID=2692826 RepID=UPI0016828981|nr:HEAT repeat domain-containing protein [Microcoleus sp. FACHB-68]MBD1939545.1 HEAT repeat domain-containing protein [Microcoleus sp. FACHB-68]
MTKHRRQSLFAAFTVLFLSLTLPVLVAGSAWAQNQRGKDAGVTQVAPLIEKLKTADEFNRDETIEALAKLGAPAVPQLIKAWESDNLLVRQGAGDALEKIGEPAVPALIKALESKNKRVRWLAAAALGDTDNSEGVPVLVKALKDPDTRMRRIAAQSLVGMSFDSSKSAALSAAFKAAVPDLVNALNDKDADVRSHAAWSLVWMGIEAKAAVPDLVNALNDKDAYVRSSAASALDSIGTEAKAAVPGLINALKDENARVRANAASALGSIGTEAKAVVPDLVNALNDKDADVRGNAASALGKIGTEAKAAVPDLVNALKDENAYVRSRAASALGKIGTEAKAAVPDLVNALKDENDEVRGNAASALQSIALSLQEKANTLSPKELDKTISDLEAALKILEAPKAEFSADNIRTFHLSLNALKAQRNANLTYWIQQNPWRAGILFYLLFFPSLWLTIFWLRPRWLLRINDALKPYEFKLPETLGGAPIRIRDLTFFSLFVYHPRVLDAWVAKHIETFHEEFSKLETVKRRATYVPVDVELDDKKISLEATELQATFNKKRICLLLYGEGGIGKTSIACQMALWAMESDQTKRLCKHRQLPILIEEELSTQIPQGKHPFLEAIRGKLKTLTHHPQAIDETLVKKLLEQRRLLVIVDHFSEMTEATQKQIDPDSSEFPINALVVTSRLKSSLGKDSKTTIQPQKIQGAKLADFMEKYLDKLGKPSLLKGPDFHKLCADFARLLEEAERQQRSTTVLLARLYADLVIARKEGKKDENLPETIPDLMLEYVNEINRDVATNRLDERTVHADAKAIAWECLKPTYKPATAKFKDAIAALSALNPQDVEIRLKYLEETLRLIQTVGAAKEDIRFTLDPVAEYLAGLHLIDVYGNNDSKWQGFLTVAESQPGFPDAIKGFLLAVRDCYLTKIPGAKNSDFLPKEIEHRCIPSAPPAPVQPVPVSP